MSWDYKETSYFLKNGKIDKKAEASEILCASLLPKKRTIVKLCIGCDGNVYAAMLDNCAKVFAACVSFDCEIGGFYYRIETEDVGPCACNCPACILDILTPTTHDFALAWRDDCRKNLYTGAQALHKKSFYIRVTDRDGHEGARAVQGYVTTIAGRGFGFYNCGGEWTATDLYSGFKLSAQKTRKAAVDYCIFAMRRDDVRRALEGSRRLSLDYIF